MTKSQVGGAGGGVTKSQVGGGGVTKAQVGGAGWSDQVSGGGAGWSDQVSGGGGGVGWGVE